MITAKNSNKGILFLAKKEFGRFVGIFLFLLITTAIIINFGIIKEIFNFKEIHGEAFNYLKSKFEKKKEIALKISEVELSSSESKFEFSDKPDSIEIPKIKVSAPIILPKSSTRKDLQAALKKGTVFYSDSDLPGKPGMTVVLGHSAPSGWPKINYDWVFSRLNGLSEGDEIFVYFDHKKYNYRVIEKIFLNKEGEIPDYDPANQKSILIMLSCWPPGLDLKRIAVQAELQY
jgi:LPXTG-site transpeptidase (sortase) family protein